MSKIKDEDRILRTREKQQVQGNSYISINFSEETMQSKMEWQDIFKLMKKNKTIVKNTLPGKIIIHIWRNDKYFTDK